jgi:hypothetical protein
MGKGGAMGSKTAKGLRWVMGWQRWDGRHNGQQTITNDAEAGGDVRCTTAAITMVAAARSQWAATTAMALAAIWAAGRQSDRDG